MPNYNYNEQQINKVVKTITTKDGLLRKRDDQCNLKEQIKNVVIKNDEIQAINRYKWNGLPKELNANIIERVLYYKGQGAFLCIKSGEENKFYFLPYCLEGSIDLYGRYTGIVPLPFNGKSEVGNDNWLANFKRIPVYEEDNELLEEKEIYCVLLNDYSNGISQNIQPRSTLNNGVIDVISECIPYCRTAMQNSTGTMGIKVGSDDDSASVFAANNIVKKASLEGSKYVAISGGSIEFQELAGGNPASPVDFLQTMESLDNFRLSSMGIKNGGLFQKKAHMLQEEQDLGSDTTDIILEDGLDNRKKFCELVNFVFKGLLKEEISVDLKQNQEKKENSDVVKEGDNNVNE